MSNTNTNPQTSPRSSTTSKSTRNYQWDENSFHCSAEWHLVRMYSNCAPGLYSFAQKLSKNSGVFSASAERVAKYLDVERKTVLRALEELVSEDFFELIRIERFKPNVYRVVIHKEWAKKHPGRCVQKDAMPWDGDGDPLGRQLFAISGQRVRFLPNQVTGLRKLGFSDDQIIKAFPEFLVAQDYEGKRWRYAYYDFLAYLKSSVVLTDAAHDEHSGDTEYHRRDAGGVPPVVLDGVPSVSRAEYHRRDASLRYESPKGVFEGKSTIPALRSQERSLSSPTNNKIPGSSKATLQEQRSLAGRMR